MNYVLRNVIVIREIHKKYTDTLCGQNSGFVVLNLAVHTLIASS